jgi:hypothetical protein
MKKIYIDVCRTKAEAKARIAFHEAQPRVRAIVRNEQIGFVSAVDVTTVNGKLSVDGRLLRESDGLWLVIAEKEA